MWVDRPAVWCGHVGWLGVLLLQCWVQRQQQRHLPLKSLGKTLLRDLISSRVCSGLIAAAAAAVLVLLPLLLLPPPNAADAARIARAAGIHAVRLAKEMYQEAMRAAASSSTEAGVFGRLRGAGHAERQGRQGGRRAVNDVLTVCLRAGLLPGKRDCLVGKLLRVTRAAAAGAAAFWHLYLCAVAIVQTWLHVINSDGTMSSERKRSGQTRTKTGGSDK